MPNPSLILASSSPYRRALLTRLGLPYVAESPDLDESPAPGEPAETLVVRLAVAKARGIAERHPGSVVIGSDQVAVRDAEILGKPGDVAGAESQLMASSGRTVRFLTAVCVIGPDGEPSEHLDETRVRFRDLSEEEVRRYVAVERPLDCAGAFKVEGLGISLFEAVETGDPTALIGLPLIALCRMLRGAGMRIPS
jgi:7-methyl-GTP pyrophosphatase